MNNTISQIAGNSSVLPVPVARVPIAIRAAGLSDLPFIDSLQKMHTKAVGWMPTNQLEGCIKLGRVLVAQEMQNDERRMKRRKANRLIRLSSAPAF